MAKLTVTYAQYSDIGGRTANEDAIGSFTANDRGCFILCDGLGGHGMGDVASSTVVNVFQSLFSQSVPLKKAIGDSFSAAQDILCAQQKAKNIKGKMKTTAVALMLDDRYAYIGHVGDSRAYVFKGNKLLARTLDHSIPQMLAIAGDIKDEEIRAHPDRNIVLRVIGSSDDESSVDLMKPIRLRKHFSFLLCSDGFWESITEDEMISTLKSSMSVDEWLSMMKKLVLNAESTKEKDNNSAIAVWCR